MSLRNSYAAVLQLLRTEQGLTQAEMSGAVSQTHVSHLELARGSVTLDAASEIAAALNVQPASMLILALASHERRSAREMLQDCLTELEGLGLADRQLPVEPKAMETTATVEARRKRLAVQDLKAKGLTQAQAAKELGMAESTLRRLWHQTDQG